jgi:predicted ATPase
MGSTAREGTATGLVGRDHECAVIDGLLDGASEGNSGALVLRGEAGTGKTSLLQCAAERADELRVLKVTGVQGESDLDFAGLHSLVRPIVGYLAKLPEPQRDAVEGALGLAPSRGADRFLVSAGVLSLLAAAAEECSLLCLVDDAQWLDVPSAASLVFTARRLGAEGLVIMFAAREGERRRFDAPGLGELVLGGLDHESPSVLLSRSAPDATPWVRKRSWPRRRVTRWRCSSFRPRCRTGSLPAASCCPTHCR